MSEIHWRYVVEIRAHSPRELKSERKVCGECVQVHFAEECFSRAFHMEGVGVVVGLFLAQILQYGGSSQENNLPLNDNTARQALFNFI